MKDMGYWNARDRIKFGVDSHDHTYDDGGSGTRAKVKNQAIRYWVEAVFNSKSNKMNAMPSTLVKHLSPKYMKMYNMGIQSGNNDAKILSEEIISSTKMI